MPYTPTLWVDGSSPDIDAANLNHLENGLQAAAAVADAALPTPAGTNGQFLKRVGGVWVPTSFAASDIPSFPSDATKLLDGSGAWRVLATGDVPANVPISKLADPGAGKFIGSAGAGAVALQPPGTVLANAVLSNATLTSISNTGSEASPVDIISVTYTANGTDVVQVELSGGAVQWTSGFAVGDAFGISLWEASDLGRSWMKMAQQNAVAITEIGLCARSARFTPSSGSHTYKFRMWKGGTGTMSALYQDGGQGAAAATHYPAFSMRVVKVA